MDYLPKVATWVNDYTQDEAISKTAVFLRRHGS